MRIAIAGATGRLGTLVTQKLQDVGHDTVAISRSRGVDLVTGDGLDDALTGVEAVVDTTNTLDQDEKAAVDFFSRATDNLLATEQRAGVRHHVLLSIVNVDRVSGVAHYAGKLAQEERVSAGVVPWSIVRATQFFDFPELVAGWSVQDGASYIPPLLMQPIAPADVAAMLVAAVTGDPTGRINIAGPEPQDFVDMARRTLAARGTELKLIPTWGAMFGPTMAGNALLPDESARIQPTTFDDWLDEQRPT